MGQEVLGQERDRDDGVERREGQLADAGFQCPLSEFPSGRDEGAGAPDGEVGSEILAPAWVEPVGADDGYDAEEKDDEGVRDAAERGAG